MRLAASFLSLARRDRATDNDIISAHLDRFLRRHDPF